MQLVSLNPLDGTEVGAVPALPLDQVPQVVAAARAAAPAWAARTPSERAELLAAAAPALNEQVDALAVLLTREMGKPLPDARGEVERCAAGLPDAAAEVAEAIAPEVIVRGTVRSTIHFDPLGVCVVITPWNFPIAMPHQLIVAALVAGNPVIVKPSEETPLIADAWVRTLAARLPEGVLQIVHGDGRLGAELVRADVDLIAFTGSRATGSRILAAAADGLKRVVLELGGKDPLLVLDGADLDAAADFAARNCFRNTGQVCVSTERIYVQRELHDAFVAKLVDRASKLVVGDGLQPGTDLGPMIHARQKRLVLEQVHDALRAGASLRFGALDAAGCLLGPIVITDVDHGMALMREETFGPVAPVMRVDDADHAVALANDTRFGLGAVVFAGAGAHDIARRVQAGMVGVGRSCGGVHGTPWVGARESGYGFHSGVLGHRQFAQVRVLTESIG